MRNLFDILPRAELVRIIHVSPHNTTLIMNILNPLDKLVPRAFQFLIQCKRTRSRENQYGLTPFIYIMYRATKILRPALHQTIHERGTSTWTITHCGFPVIYNQ